MDNRPARVELVEAMISPAIDATIKDMFNRASEVTSRQLMAVAAAKLHQGDIEIAEAALNVVLDHQIVNESDSEFGAYVQSIYSRGYYGRECLMFRIGAGVPTNAGDSVSASVKLPHLEPGSTISAWVNVDADYGHRGYHYLDILVDGVVILKADLLNLGDGWQRISADIPPNLCLSERPEASFRLRQLHGVRHHPISVILSSVEISCDVNSQTNLVSEPWEIEPPTSDIELAVLPGSSFDINSSAFCLLQTVGILYSGDFCRLSPSIQERLRSSLNLALRRIVDDPIAQLGYTNARLIRDISLMLVGRWLGLSYFYERGKDYFREWLNFTRAFGIREYGSPVYYAVDIEALYLCYQYSQDELVKADAKSALDFLWLDIAANYFPARGSLSGSHSRDPDLIDGRGSLELFFFIEGWRGQPLEYSIFDYQKVQCYANNPYYPDLRVLDLVSKLPKEVSARTDQNANLDRYNFVTPEWAMGSTSATFTNVIPGQGGPTPTDRAINIEIGGISGPSTVSILPSAARTPTNGGHLPLFPSVVQHRNMLLAHLDLDPSLVRTTALSTNILVPLGVAEVQLDGHQVQLDRPNVVQGSPDSNLFLRVANTSIGLRIIGADVVHPGPLSVKFELDEDGLVAGVGRLVIQHYRGHDAVRPRTRNAYVGIYIEIGTVNSDFERQFDAVQTGTHARNGSRVTTAISTSGDRLEVSSEIAHRVTLARRINGVDFRAPSILTVNGVDYSSTLGPIS